MEMNKMTKREQFIKTLKCEKIGGRVPHMELQFFLTMEKFRKVHPRHRTFHQWNQMSKTEQKLHINDTADVYIQMAETYDYSALHIEAVNREILRLVLENIREKTGDQYFLTVYSDPTWPIPDGSSMVDFSVQMLEEPEALNEISKRRLAKSLDLAEYLDKNGHYADGNAHYQADCRLQTGCHPFSGSSRRCKST